MKIFRNILAVVIGILTFYAICSILILVLALLTTVPLIYSLLTLYIPQDYLTGIFPWIATAVSVLPTSKISTCEFSKYAVCICLSIIAAESFLGMIFRIVGDGFILSAFFNDIMYIICPIVYIYFETNDSDKEDEE